MTDWREIRYELLATAAYLISLGHQNVFDYDFGFFILAIKAAERLRKDLIVTQASAIAAALGGQDVLQKILDE